VWVTYGLNSVKFVCCRTNRCVRTLWRVANVFKCTCTEARGRALQAFGCTAVWCRAATHWQVINWCQYSTLQFQRCSNTIEVGSVSCHVAQCCCLPRTVCLYGPNPLAGRNHPTSLWSDRNVLLDSITATAFTAGLQSNEPNCTIGHHLPSILTTVLVGKSPP
jgi:hypothetical protein